MPPTPITFVQTQEWQGTFRVEFNNGSYTDDDIVDVFTQRLIEPFNIYKNVFIPVGEYHWTRHQLTYGTSQSRRLITTFFERFGTYYNGHLNEARVRATYRTNERLSFAFGEQWNRFRLPIPDGDFSVLVGQFPNELLVLTLSHAFQPDPDEYSQYAGSERQPSSALELPPR